MNARCKCIGYVCLWWPWDVVMFKGGPRKLLIHTGCVSLITDRLKSTFKPLKSSHHRVTGKPSGDRRFAVCHVLVGSEVPVVRDSSVRESPSPCGPGISDRLWPPRLALAGEKAWVSLGAPACSLGEPVCHSVLSRAPLSAQRESLWLPLTQAAFLLSPDHRKSWRPEGSWWGSNLPLSWARAGGLDEAGKEDCPESTHISFQVLSFLSVSLGAGGLL